MSDSGIKKYKQQYSTFPPINSITEGYSVRYRIISEDRNTFSHWSPVYLIVPEYKYLPSSGVALANSISFFSDNSAKVASFTWDPISVLKPKDTYADITNKLLNNDLVTLTTSAAHYMNVGDWVTIENVGASFNGTYKINTVPSTTTFTYYKDAGNVSSSAVSPNGTRTTNSFVAYQPEYDIWIRWGRVIGGTMYGDWEYKERVSTTSASYPHQTYYTVDNILQSNAPDHISIEVYIPGSPLPTPNDPSPSFLRIYSLPEQGI